MTIIFKDERDCGAPIKYEATEVEYEFLCMLAAEDMINENWGFWKLDNIEELERDRRLCP